VRYLRDDGWDVEGITRTALFKHHGIAEQGRIGPDRVEYRPITGQRAGQRSRRFGDGFR
jgi:hypothetical protein